MNNMSEKEYRNKLGEALFKMVCDQNIAGVFTGKEISLFTQASASLTNNGREFQSFNKIPRYENDSFTISEKMDGTNGVILVYMGEGGKEVMAGSRSQWLRDDGRKSWDNHGFAAWVKEKESELTRLPCGRYYGEWYGRGINRNYGLDDRRFMLFNYKHCMKLKAEGLLPPCVEVELVTDVDVSHEVLDSLVKKRSNHLREYGSFVVPGFMRPEGLIVRSTLKQQLHKVIIDK